MKLRPNNRQIDPCRGKSERYRKGWINLNRLGSRSCGTLSIRGGGLIEKLENLNTLAKTNGEGRANEEDKGGAKCESSISMGTFAFQLNFWGSPLCSTFVYRRQTRRRLSRFSLSLSLTIYYSFFFFF